MSGYSHLTGDTDARPLLMLRLNALAEHLGVTININSGRRTLREQARLYANRASNPYPVAPPTPNDPHVEGVSADASVNGQPIQEAVDAATLKKFGIEGLSGDAVHVQIAGTVGKTASEIRSLAQRGFFRVAGAHPGKKGGTDYGGGPLGFAKEFVFGDPLEALDIGSGQGLKEDITGGVPDIAGEVVGQLAKMLGVNATAILLNIGLVGGGAALAYYGIAKMAGVSKPIGTPARAARVAVTAVPK